VADDAGVEVGVAVRDAAVPSEFVTLNGRFARISRPSTFVTWTDGIVIDGSAPPVDAAAASLTLWTMTASAPASWAFFTLCDRRRSGSRRAWRQ